jgi:hypothetical protein
MVAGSGVAERSDVGRSGVTCSEYSGTENVVLAGARVAMAIGVGLLILTWAKLSDMCLKPEGVRVCSAEGMNETVVWRTAASEELEGPAASTC